MRSFTAVEIGADTCALALTSVKRGDVHLWAADTLDPAAFPGLDAFTIAVREARRRLKLPRSCRAVVWGLADGATRRDPTVAPLIEPLTKAGFRVARVVTPCNALGALARLRVSRSGGAMCWLGINRNGVAIVVIRPGKLLYSHSFAWDSSVGSSGSQARLLQRYSLVAFLAPEVRRALAAARQKGTTVDGIVTCGNLPDLRSLTMPLIEELDIEVETLDSLEGLVVAPGAADRLLEAASSIRLACAGAVARETRSIDEDKRRRMRRTTRVASVLRVAAVVALLAGAAYWYYSRIRPAASPTKSPAPATRTASVTPRPAPTPTPIPASGATIPPKSGTSSPGAAPSPPPATGAVPRPPSATPVSGSLPPSSVLRPPPSAPVSGPQSPRSQGTLSSSPHRADKPVATSPASNPARREDTPMPELLKDPVPRVTAILVSADRRLATVGDQGQIIGVGDTVGQRTVVAIDDKTVLLREPSGVRIRVALGGRVVGVERIDR
jgi:hypothetical protein